MKQIAPQGFEVLAPSIDEKRIRDTNPRELVRRISVAKARILQPRISGQAIIITGDQVTVCDGEVREKPRNQDEARRWLQSYRSSPVDVVNGVFAVGTDPYKEAFANTFAKVWLKNLTDANIEHIIANTPAMECSGACAAGHPQWDNFTGKIDGGIDGLYGLPIETTRRLIELVSP